MLGRKEEILKLFDKIDSKELLIKLIDDMIFLEEKLEELRKLPHMKCNPKFPEIQKRTEAGKLYKEYLQQYANLVKSLASALSKTDVDIEDSPIFLYFKKAQGMNKWVG